MPCLPAHPCWQIRDLDHAWAFLARFSQAKSWPWCSSPSHGARSRDGSPGKGNCGFPSAHHTRYHGEPPAPGSLLLQGDNPATVPITFPSRSRFMSLPKLSCSPPGRLGLGAGGGELFVGNCESTFLHGCVPLCNGNPLSRVKRRPSYHDLLCRFPWIPCTINKKRNFKPVFNPA